MSKSRLRHRLCFVPIFDSEGIAGWAYSYAKRHLWRVIPDHDMDDLMGEARYVFCKLQKRYPRVRTEKHFAALFRISFANQIHTLALKRSKRVGIALTDLDPDLDLVEMLQTKRDVNLDEAEVRLIKHSCPKPLRTLIKNLVDSDLRPRYARKGAPDAEIRPRETRNEFLCRLAGEDPDTTDMVRKVRTWIYGEPVLA